MTKTLKMWLVILLTLGMVLSSCASSRPPEPVNFDTEPLIYTPLPTDGVLLEIDKRKQEIGPAPVPIIINHQGQRYAAFTLDQMKRLTAHNQLTRYLEALVREQHKQKKVYILQINDLKDVVNDQNVQLELYQKVYLDADEAVRNEERRRKIEGYIYKVIIAGQIVAILALL